MSELLTASQFEEKVLKALQPILVDFFATWCGPCKMLAPVLDEVSAEVVGRGAIYKVDVDQEPTLAAQFGVMSVPTLILFKNGEATHRLVGVQAKQALLDLF